MGSEMCIRDSSITATTAYTIKSYPTSIHLIFGVLFCFIRFTFILFSFALFIVYPPPRKLGGFHPFIILFNFVIYFFSSGVNKTVPCSVSVPISSTLVDFTIVPDFNVQLSPIKLYGSTTVLAPITVA